MQELTENAIKRLSYIANKAGTRYVRLDIKGGGCAGFEYKWETTDTREDTDCLLGDILIVSLELEMYLLGTTLDWVEDTFSSEFKITNLIVRAVVAVVNRLASKNFSLICANTLM